MQHNGSWILTLQLHPLYHHVELSHLLPGVSNQNIANSRICLQPNVKIQPVQRRLAVNIYTSRWLRLLRMIDEAQRKYTPSPTLFTTPPSIRIAATSTMTQ